MRIEFDSRHSIACMDEPFISGQCSTGEADTRILVASVQHQFSPGKKARAHAAQQGICKQTE